MEEEKTYLPFPLALRAAKKTYEGNPAQPTDGFAKDLLDMLRDVLDIPSTQREIITFYPAIETPLYEFHGVTDWIELANREDEQPIIVTLEIVPEDGRSGQKADVVLENLPRMWDQTYDDFLLDTSAKVIVVLANKL